jgi:2-amino-4-hydroxy-6-hydroxymethyldihydropteridine diphosphokinase
MTEVYLAAGGNVEPLKYLDRALGLLERTFGPLVISPAYRNPAVGFVGDDFVNLVVGFRTSLPAAEVRERLQVIETACERPHDAPKWGPRTMDLDLLLYGDEISDVPGLALPRPDLVRRAYMLRPMADIAPDLVHPTLHKTMRELWEAFGSDHEMVELGEWRRADGGR